MLSATCSIFFIFYFFVVAGTDNNKKQTIIIIVVVIVGTVTLLLVLFCIYKRKGKPRTAAGILPSKLFKLLHHVALDEFQVTDTNI